MQRRWSSTEGGVEWASTSRPIGQLTYNTFVEDDFNVIFDNYIYAANARSWANYDFGKAGCSCASPNHSVSEARVLKTWTRKVPAPSAVHCVSYVSRAEKSIKGEW